MILNTIIALALVRLATAQKGTTNSTEPSCENPGVYKSFNVTSTNVIPGFQPANITASNWTLNFGVSDIRNTTDEPSTTDLYMWIDSTDNDTDLDSPDLPYTGCLVTLSLGRRRESTGGSIGPDGQDGCEGVFSEKCYNAVVKAAQASAKQPLNGADPEKRCIQIVDWDSEECDDEDSWWGLSANVLFGNGTHSPANNTDNCGDLGVTEGAQVRTSTNLQPPTTDQSYDNRTFYDSVVSNASPFFLIGMMKESPGKWSDEQWGDARLICASPAKTIRESAATRAVGRNGGIWGVMAVGVVVVLFGVM